MGSMPSPPPPRSAADGGGGRRIGFAGLGAMGLGMATNLLKAGFSVTGFDPNPEALARFGERGGVAVDSAAAAASRGQGRFAIMVANAAQLESVLFGEGVVSSSSSSSLSSASCSLAALSRDAVVLVFSTLPPALVCALPARLAALGRADVRVVDCPVSGGAIGATNGTLSVMVGASQSLHDDIQDELRAISAPGRIFHCGPLGSASTLKMLNQHLAGSHIVAAAETLAFARALDLPVREAYEILMAGAASSWIMGDRGVSMLSRNWAPRSAVSIFVKDLTIVSDSSDDALLPIPLAAAALQAFVEQQGRGHGGLDDASVVCLYEEIIGRSVSDGKPPRTPPPPPSPTTTPPRELEPVQVVVFLVDGDDSQAAAALYKILDQQGGGGGEGGKKAEETRLRVVPSASAAQTLRAAPRGALVGFPAATPPAGDDNDEKALSSEFPDIKAFDYALLPPDPSGRAQMVFSSQDPADAEAVMKAFAGGSSAARKENSPPLPLLFLLLPITGPRGTAARMRAAVRLASLVHAAVAAECCALAAARGVARDALYALVAGAAGSSAAFNRHFPDMAAGRFDLLPGGEGEGMASALEDLSLLKATMLKLGFPGRMLDAAHQVFKRAGARAPPASSSIAAVALNWS